MSSRYPTSQIMVFFALCAVCLICLIHWHTSTALAQTESILIIQMKADSDVQQLSTEYNLTVLEVVPALSIYKVQLNSPELLSSLGSDSRVLAFEQEKVTPIFETNRQTLAPNSPEVEMLQRYIGFGSEDDSSDINPVPDLYSGSKKTKSVEQVLIDGHLIKLDDKMRKWAFGEVKLDKALKKATGAGVIVAVLDTGVDLDHPHLVDHLLPGYDFVEQDAIPDDQSDGYDEDEDGQRDEGVGHGTHVAGIIATVAPRARILPVRVLNSDGAGTRFDIIQGTVYAVEQGADVINFSLSTSENSAMLASAIDYALQHGVIVVAAASGDESSLEYPAAYSGVISVGSVRKDHRFSNFTEAYAWRIDIAAPGELIYSTYIDGQYAWWSGSSMAAPFVSAGAALMRQYHRCSTDCVKRIITSEVEDIKDRKKFGAECGGLNLEKAVKKAADEEPIYNTSESASFSCGDGDPEKLIFEYTEDDCSAGTNSQGSKFKCSGNPGSETVSIFATKDANKIAITPNRVQKGDLVTVYSTEGKALKDLKLEIGNQSMEIDTSCNLPLNIDDSFGSLVLRDYFPAGLIGRSGDIENGAENTIFLPLVNR